MPFLSASENVRSLLMAGALEAAERLLGMGWDSARIFAALKSQFAPLSGEQIPWQSYYSVIARAESALESGRRLMRKRSNQPLDDDLYTGMPGLTSRYQYTVVMDFINDQTGLSFTRAFHFSSNESLGKFDILAMARRTGLEFAQGGNNTLPSAAGGTISLGSRLRITDALMRI